MEHGEEQYFFFSEPFEELKIRAVWSHIDSAFSRPVLESDSTADYAPTLVIAEFIKSKGYDGIVYKSALAEGYNLALFDLDSADLVNCTTFELKSLPLSFPPTENLYYVDRRKKQITKRSTGRQKRAAFGSLRWRSGAGYLSVISGLTKRLLLAVCCRYPLGREP
ncbi:RES family NAD+ phosphorylase [Halomonas taeanensis]|uniref:RES family NAD+ phosphorylase n=1 Tax=Onishia taeanensis TaxID=284577 RepID=UPI0015EC7F30